ncbi:MAG: 4-alpha-glucanotransferase, partial [Bacilli bacterium]
KDATNKELTLKICELNMMSKTRCAICPMQDLLGIGKEGRMNFPSTLSTNNWSWRCKQGFFNKKITDWLNIKTKMSGRD